MQHGTLLDVPVHQQECRSRATLPSSAIMGDATLGNQHAYDDQIGPEGYVQQEVLDDVTRRLKHEQSARIKAEREREEARARISHMERALSNPHNSATHRIAMALAPGLLGKITRQDGWCDMTAYTFGERSGMSEDTAQKRLQELAAAGKIETKEERYPFKQDDVDCEGTHVLRRLPRGEGLEREWGTVESWGKLPPCKTATGDNTRHTQARNGTARTIEGLKNAVTLLYECRNCGEQSTHVVCEHCEKGVPVAEVVKAFLPAPQQTDRDHTAAPSARGGEGNAKRGGCTETLSPTTLLATTAETLGADQDEQSLAAAVATLLPGLRLFQKDHIVMQNQSENDKYVTRKGPLTATDIKRHLLCEIAVGAGLFQCSPDGERQAQCFAWDTDDDLPLLLRSADLLRARGLYPIIDGNPSDAKRGHLWLLFNRPLNAAHAIAGIEAIALELATLAERFPNPGAKNGQRIRIPGGGYVEKGFGTIPIPVPFLSSIVNGVPQWVAGNTPAAWRIIAASVSDASLLPLASPSSSPESEMRQETPTLPSTRSQAKPIRATDAFTGGFDYRRFNNEHPIEHQVEIGRDNKFLASWRNERTASVTFYPKDGHWWDYGRNGRNGRDAWGLWCAINGYWDEANNKPDHKAGRAAALKEWPYLRTSVPTVSC